MYINFNSLIEIKFEINIFSLFSFLAGILAGFIILGLIYLLNCLLSLKKKTIKINKEIKNISENDIKDIIHKYQDAFNDEKRRRKNISGSSVRLSGIKWGVIDSFAVTPAQ